MRSRNCVEEQGVGGKADTARNLTPRFKGEV